ncbi:MAG: ribonuclease P [Candidatus Diapherotrites archaeon]|nr:ribonuclease P [Candidatus Diapherotrites archaeon]
MNAKQKLALERIYRLFELATKTKDASLQKRYVSLAKKIGERVNVSIPTELKQTFCKKCYSMNVKPEKKAPFLIVSCKDCKTVKKFSLEAK